jgi:hypothetical protein
MPSRRQAMARLIERWLELRALAVLEEHRDREHAHAEAKAASDHHEGSPADLTRVRLKPIATSFRENRRRPGEVSCSPSKGINRSSFARRLRLRWWARQGSNLQPSASKADALSIELRALSPPLIGRVLHLHPRRAKALLVAARRPLRHDVGEAAGTWPCFVEGQVPGR